MPRLKNVENQSTSNDMNLVAYFLDHPVYRQTYSNETNDISGWRRFLGDHPHSNLKIRQTYQASLNDCNDMPE